MVGLAVSVFGLWTYANRMLTFHPSFSIKLVSQVLPFVERPAHVVFNSNI